MRNKQIGIFSIIGIIGLLAVLLFFYEDPANTVTIHITSDTKPFSQDVYPPGPDVYALKKSWIGMWDDTIILNGNKVPPQKIKSMGKPIDFYGEDPIKFSYDPYKARKVELKVIYDFCR